MGWVSDVLGRDGNQEGLRSALWLVPTSILVALVFWTWGWRVIPEDAATLPDARGDDPGEAQVLLP